MQERKAKHAEQHEVQIEGDVCQRQPYQRSHYGKIYMVVFATETLTTLVEVIEVIGFTHTKGNGSNKPQNN